MQGLFDSLPTMWGTWCSCILGVSLVTLALIALNQWARKKRYPGDDPYIGGLRGPTRYTRDQVKPPPPKEDE
jgi:hypothetical protein